MTSKYINYWISINGVSHIIEIFEKQKIDIRFVGGCIRDALLGNINSDIDLAVNCNPDHTSKILNQNNIVFLEYGKQYGTITAVIEKKNYEITSLREDINPTGRYTEIKFTNDWYKDASRRDFTFNAINISSTGKVGDYFNGQQDIKNQQVKFIGSINDRIQQDYLRILRYFRFLGLFKNPNIIKEYEEVLYEHLPQLRKHVPNYRIRDELLKMLKNEFKMNSIFKHQNYKETNILIATIRKWWTEDSYELGLYKCMNEIDSLVVN